MQSERLGFVTFFGVLIPGSYITGVIFLAIMSWMKVYETAGLDQVIKILSKNVALSSIVFFFVSYLFGVLVRLFAPHIVDGMSKYYLLLRLKKDDWVTDVFPYKKTINTRLKRDGMEKVNELITLLNSKYGGDNNTSFFNYCKWFIDANSTTLSRQVHQAEALVRFLSGATIALLFTIIISAAMWGVAYLNDVSIIRLIFGVSFICSIFGTCLILERFKYQRRREVYMVWFCIYIIVNGGVLENSPNNFDKLVDSVFFK